jgi:ribosomal-protein-alanine N-acetyltransferase
LIRPLKEYTPPLLPDIALEGSRVVVRPPQREDWVDWAAVRRKNQDFLKPFEPVWPQNALDADHFDRRLRRQAADWQTGRAHAFLIFMKADLVGGININNICRGAAQFASLGYWLAKDAQGRGYMAEALRLICGYAFADLKLHRLNAGCLPDNARSRNLLLRAGFREEGFAEKYLEIDGRWQDHILFGLTVENWRTTPR